MRHVLMFLLALCLPMTANAQRAVSLDIGGREVKVEVPAGYVRYSEAVPALNDVIQKALPQTNLLIDTFADERDLVMRNSGSVARYSEYEVQTLRALGTADIGPEEWKIVRPMMLQQIGAMDPSTLNDDMQKNVGGVVADETGGAVKLEVGEVARPALYGDDPDSVRFTMILPSTFVVRGQKVEHRIIVAAVVAVVSRRLVFLYAQRVVGVDAPPDMAGLRADVDAFYARVRALNP